ncbi:cytochrome P450 [Hypomontagnella monticulosa]|nr:cytochrome P450 [Hypomontagnella monticulosa]
MATVMLLCISCLLYALLYVRPWHKLFPKPYPGIPYNEVSARRIFGDVRDISSAIRAAGGFSDAILAITTRKLDTPIAQVLFPILRKPLIVVDDPHEVEDILWRRQREFDVAQTSLDLMAPMFPHGWVSQFTTPQLKAEKQLWAGTMATGFLQKAVAPLIYTSTLELVHLWRLRQITEDDPIPFDVAQDFRSASLDIIWAAITGDNPGVLKLEIDKLPHPVRSKTQMPKESCGRRTNQEIHDAVSLMEGVASLNDVISRNAASLFPKWAQKLETYTRRHHKFRAIVGNAVSRMVRRVDERFRDFNPAELEDDWPSTCMMDIVLRRRVLEAKKTGKPLGDLAKDQVLLDQVFTLLIAGYGNTANTLTWFVKFMEAHQEVQSKLRAELRAAFPHAASATGSPSSDEIIRADIPYLDAVCEETLRYSGNSRGNLRQALVDTEILGCRVPRGAEVLLHFHVDQSPPPVDESRRSVTSRAAMARVGDGLRGAAGQRLGQFDPSRWLSEGGDKFNGTALPRLSFGGGYRGCFGKNLAMMQFRIFAVLLILHFEFLELPGELVGMGGSERLFWQPDKAFAKIRCLIDRDGL